MSAASAFIYSVSLFAFAYGLATLNILYMLTGLVGFALAGNISLRDRVHDLEVKVG